MVIQGQRPYAQIYSGAKIHSKKYIVSQLMPSLYRLENLKTF